jgi:hypothetical protein
MLAAAPFAMFAIFETMSLIFGASVGIVRAGALSRLF